MRAAVAVASLVSLFLAGGAGDAGTMGFPVVAAWALLSAAVFFLAVMMRPQRVEKRHKKAAHGAATPQTAKEVDSSTVYPATKWKARGERSA